MYLTFYFRLQDQVRHYVEADVNRRREYLKTVAMTCMLCGIPFLKQY